MRKHEIDSVGVVRASVLELPIADAAVDYTFSIGVMQHTGNGPQMVSEMARIVPKGHNVSLNCYGTGTETYEKIDAAIRARTTKMSQEDKMRFANRIAKTHRGILKMGALGRMIDRQLHKYMCIRPTLVQMYDWYAPAIAHHYDPEQLSRVFSENGLEVIAANFPFHKAGYSDEKRKKRATAFNMLLRKT